MTLVAAISAVRVPAVVPGTAGLCRVVTRTSLSTMPFDPHVPTIIALPQGAATHLMTPKQEDADQRERETGLPMNYKKLFKINAVHSDLYALVAAKEGSSL